MASKAKTPKASLLFHPRKKPQVKKEPEGTPPRKSNGNGSARPASPKPDSDKDTLNLPEGPYQEFRLMSSALNGWKYDVMKFDSRKGVDISTWEAPIKLNRKELKREPGPSGSLGSLMAMLGSDGKPVIGSDGRIVMVDAEGRPVQSGSAKDGKDKDAKGKGSGNGRKKFQKKTRQVFLVPEATRQLRKEERYPWVIEDAGRKEVWVGKLEEVSKSETHAFFMPAAADVFKFVPAHRWYKFQKKPHYHVPDLEEAESIMSQMQKNKDPERWLLHRRNGMALSSATAATFKAEAEGRVMTNGSLVPDSGQSLGPGGRRLRAVDSGRDLFGEDDDEDVKRRRQGEGPEGDIDEQIYEEEFADDEEKMEEDIEGEEEKELEERLKKEYRSANKQRDGHIDESEDEQDVANLTKDGKAMKKLIRNLEKNNAYDSDEEKNPYASSEDEDEGEEEVPTTNGPAIQQQPQQKSQPASRSGSQPPSRSGQPVNASQKASRAGSRAASPAPNSSQPPALGGHSMVAKRATSPKGLKTISNGGSHGKSPLASGQGSRATSPSGSRASSPQASPLKSNNNKRKATDDVTPNGATPPKPKKRKSHGVGAGSLPVGELDEKMVIEWFRKTPNVTTRDCIQHFTPYLTDEGKKKKFTALIKEVAQLKGGKLTLRDAYRVESQE